MTDRLRAAAEAAIGAMVRAAITGHSDALDGYAEALRAALAEQSPKMPSDTRYTVVVEGQAPTYWDNIHDAITDAQRAVYAGVDNLTHAINDLQGGRIAEWSYGFSAVRIYPPQKRAALAEPTCKSCLQVAEQDAEPFIWYADDTGDTWTPEAVAEGWAPTDLRPLYAHPPRREWVGLTDEEIADAIRPLCEENESVFEQLLDFSMDEYRAIEAALKEKNA